MIVLKKTQQNNLQQNGILAKYVVNTAILESYCRS